MQTYSFSMGLLQQVKFNTDGFFRRFGASAVWVSFPVFFPQDVNSVMMEHFSTDPNKDFGKLLLL